MHCIEKHTIERHWIADGMPASHMCYTAQQKYVHGSVADLWIAGKYHVYSQSILKMLETWGVRIPYNSGHIDLPVAGMYYIELHDVLIMKYECNSRQVFKPINDLIKGIKAMQRIGMTYEPAKNYRNLSFTWLISSLQNMTTEQCLELAQTTWGLTTTLDHLQNDKFRHYYKILHPQTRLYYDD